ncbi:MAG: endonuclease III [candidate division Zixibacteria bacterium]|nr:endonuclease III [candidate division Zixibacteria bacterium]
MRDDDIHIAIPILEEESQQWTDTALSAVAAVTRQDPFRILIGTVLSLRTQDRTTAKACQRLFALAANPADMQKLSEETIDRAIYPVGFHFTKARHIREICAILIEQYDSRVPDDLDTLLTLPGVGRKTANLVITLGYGKPGICVDTHVHRITNRWGYVSTRTPEETEFALRAKLPPEYWIRINDLLVTYGQNLCKPISPHCSRCRLASLCARIGVDKSR